MNAGPGKTSGGGGRRRRRGRRQHSQRGQRPGPGLSRENKDGIYTAPMDHSYRAVMGGNNGHKGGGRQRPGFQTQYPQPEPEPLPASNEDTNSRIFAFIEDLFFMAKIQETARKLGIKVGFVKADKDIVAKLANVPEDAKPSLIVFDLNNANAKPLTLIPKLKTKLKRGTSVIGFLSHLQGDLKVKALEAGCDMVMPRSAFSQNLPNLLRRHGLDQEIEAVEA